MRTALKILRTIRDPLLSFLTATLGTAIAEAEFEAFFHPQTLSGIYRKELILSGVVAFVLGCLAYFKCKSKASQWLWILGFIGFAWRLAFFDNPVTVEAETERMTLDVVSLRLVTYSAGALCCAALVKRAPAPPAAAERLEGS